MQLIDNPEIQDKVKMTEMILQNIILFSGIIQCIFSLQKRSVHHYIRYSVVPIVSLLPNECMIPNDY